MRTLASGRCLFSLVTVAATLSWYSAVTSAGEANPDSAAAAIWWSGTVDLSRPLGNFDPPGDTPQLGFGAHLSYQPPFSAFGIRLELGTASSRVTVDSVAVEVLPGFATYEGVSAGNDVRWFLVGGQWDPRPTKTSVYAFTSLGVLHVSPHGKAGNNTTLNGEVPGLPPSTNVFAYEVGVGSRLVAGEHFGLNAEAEYVHGGAAEYVGSAGVEGSNPAHYASRSSAIDLFVVRLGFVWR